MSKTYGYIRVSTKEQNEDRQLIALQNIGIPPDHIFMDKQSGKDFERPQYKKLVRRMKKDDLLYVKSIDRLGRNYDEILDQWRHITRVLKVNVVVLDMPLLDTRTKTNGITGTFVADLVLQILSYVAEVEREGIKQRQAEGIAAAKQRGVQFGRPPLAIPLQFWDVRERYLEKEMSLTAASAELGVARQTFLKWCNSQAVQ